MPDVTLEPLDTEPPAPPWSVLDVKGTITLPPDDGDVNLLCGHCSHLLAERLVAANALRNPAGVALGCPNCGKYSRVPS